LLRRGRMSLTLQALIAPGTIAQIARPPKDRQVADDRPFIIPVTLSIVMIKSPTLLISVLNTRTSGISNGTVTCAFFIEAIHLCDLFALFYPPHLGGTTVFPNET
jgi:hypothetical protein